MSLKPLCSERLARHAAESQRNSLFESLSLGASGLWTMSSNLEGAIDNYKLANLSIGLSLITSAALIYFTPGETEAQNRTLQEMGLAGIEKEEAAYSLLKSSVYRGRENRKYSGLLLAVTGIGWGAARFHEGQCYAVLQG